MDTLTTTTTETGAVLSLGTLHAAARRLNPNLKGETLELIEFLQLRETEACDYEKHAAELDPLKHKIYDPIIRPDKTVVVNNKEKTEKVARIGLSLQKEIVKKSVSFLFGTEPKINSTAETETQKNAVKAIEKIMATNKGYSLNRKAGRSLLSFREVAEYWFPVEEEEQFDSYGFTTRFKVKHMLFSPERGDKLFPVFDETGDLVIFSRSYSRKHGTETIDYFESYTKEAKVVFWKGTATGVPADWAVKDVKKIAIGKMPIVYGYKSAVEWEDVQPIIERLEKLLSNFADTNDYHASPKIFVTGKILGFAQKGEAGGIIEGDKGTTAEYLSWSHAPESVRLEIETLLGLIFDLTNTPRISFENVKGIGAISGVALKLLFMDAHLKVKDHEEVFGEYLQRRLNVLKAYIGTLSPTWKKDVDAMEVSAEIVPYIMEDTKSDVELLMSANGNKAIISRKTAIQRSGLVENVEEEIKQIEKEEATTRVNSIFDPMLQ